MLHVKGLVMAVIVNLISTVDCRTESIKKSTIECAKKTDTIQRKIKTNNVENIVSLFSLEVPTQKHIDRQHSKKYCEKSNKSMLKRLGMQKYGSDPGRQKQEYGDDEKFGKTSFQNDDSKILLVKLPPNQQFYSNLLPCIQRFSNGSCSLVTVNPTYLNYSLNGKLDRIYHWNLPLVKKFKRKTKNNQSTTGDKQLAARNPSSSISNIDSSVSSRSVTPSIAFYGPKFRKPINSYFMGNGKPYSLYLMNKGAYRK